MNKATAVQRVEVSLSSALPGDEQRGVFSVGNMNIYGIIRTAVQWVEVSLNSALPRDRQGGVYGVEI